MANLGTWHLTPSSTHQNLTTLTGVSFTVGNKYVIQIIGKAFFRRGELGRGIYIDNNTPFEYKPSVEEDIFILVQNDGIDINIDESVVE